MSGGGTPLGAGPVVVALGGNAIIQAKDDGTIEEQFHNAGLTLAPVAGMIGAGRQIVLSHGNGPIVGNILLRNEAARSMIPPMPLHVCGADSQGGIGFMMQQVLDNQLRMIGVTKTVATVVTQVVVDPADPAFDNPTKPIGPFFTSAEARRLSIDHEWVMREDSGRGFRRVVASPEPQEIIEIEAIRVLVQSGVVVIAGGGGGIPVVRNEDGTLRGVDAVIDKDRSSVVLACELGARSIVFLTEVPEVRIRFGEPDEEPLERVGVGLMKRYLGDGEFPPGSMGPKIEAALRFLDQGGTTVVVTNPESLSQALEGRAGTHITNEGAPAPTTP